VFKNIHVENLLWNLLSFCDETNRKFIEEFPFCLWMFYPIINRLIFTCRQRKKSLRKRVLCDSLERFTSVRANNIKTKIVSSLQSLVWISSARLRKKRAGLVPDVVTSSCCAALRRASSWKDAPAVPLCVVQQRSRTALLERGETFPFFPSRYLLRSPIATS